jgi:hypothetical protein
MSKLYKNRVLINSGSGSGWVIKAEENFEVMVGNFENMKGTYIYIFGNRFFYSDKNLESEDVKDFTYEDALEVVLQNISVEGFNEVLIEKYKDGIYKGKLNFAKKLKKLVKFN